MSMGIRQLNQLRTPAHPAYEYLPLKHIFFGLDFIGVQVDFLKSRINTMFIFLSLVPAYLNSATIDKWLS